MSRPLPIIVDCDPGTDDALALLMLMAYPEVFHILGITTVGGNVSLERVTENALKLCELAGRTDLSVYAGCGRPLVKPASVAEFVHGISGLGNATLPTPQLTKSPLHGVDFLIEAILKHPEPVTLMPIGPLTNIAMALIKEPRIQDNIEKIVFMGGSIYGGNVPGGFAEFNIFNDPHAAHVVFSSALPLVMAGLDVTHKMLLTAARKEKIAALKSQVAQELLSIMSFAVEIEKERFDLDGNIIHDACAAGYLMAPHLFKGKDCPLFVEIYSQATLGQTVIDWHNWHNAPTRAHVLYDLDEEGFFEVILNAIKRYEPDPHKVITSTASLSMGCGKN